MKKSLKYGVAVAIALAVGSQLSIVTLGDRYAGSTVLVWRTGSLSKLRPVYDTDTAVCEREGQPNFPCRGGLAMAILGNDIARWAVNGR